MKQFQIGDSIRFEASGHTDFDGEPVSPVTVTCKVNYPDAGSRTTADVTMTQSGTAWRGTWDSSVADEGVIDWSIKSVGANTSVKEGQFELIANRANPDA